MGRSGNPNDRKAHNIWPTEWYIYLLQEYQTYGTQGSSSKAKTNSGCRLNCFWSRWPCTYGNTSKEQATSKTHLFSTKIPEVVPRRPGVLNVPPVNLEQQPLNKIRSHIMLDHFQSWNVKRTQQKRRLSFCATSEYWLNAMTPNGQHQHLYSPKRLETSEF